VNNIIITIDTIIPKKKDKRKEQTTTNGLNEKYMKIQQIHCWSKTCSL